LRIFQKPRIYGNPHPLPPPKIKIQFNNKIIIINYPNVNTLFLTQWGLGIILQNVEAHTWTIAINPRSAYKCL
jgi:hypothetical protein